MNAKYGDFMDIERYGCQPFGPSDPTGPPPRGECVQYEYDPEQNLFTQLPVVDPLPPIHLRGIIFPQKVSPLAYARGNEPGGVSATAISTA